MRTALITGIYGQDGSFLCEKLKSEGYTVFGVAKKKLSVNSLKIKEELGKKNIKPILFQIDIYNFHEVYSIIQELKPDEIYHMAAYHVSAEGKGNGAIIREQELYNKNLLATANILEVCALCSPRTRILTAGSCLMFDSSATVEQDEQTLFESSSLYGLAKIAENQLVKYYRSNGLYACTAILYNHESHRRSSSFITKKIVDNMIKIKRHEIDTFTLGSLVVEKDWGYAGDYANAMFLMLQNNIPKDYVIATGKTHTVYDFILKCAQILEIDDWKNRIIIDSNIINRNTSCRLCGNSALIEEELLWKREKNFESIINEMIDYGIREYD